MDDAERDRKRPLEIRFRVADATPAFEGTTEREANRFDRFSADALVLLRALYTEEGLHLGVLALNGHAPSTPLAPSALFHLWLSFTGTLARLEPAADDPQGAQQIVFARKVLALLQLSEQMQSLGLPEDGDPDATASESSTPAGSSSPPDGVASSTG